MFYKLSLIQNLNRKGKIEENNSPTLIPRFEIIPGISNHDIVPLEYNTMLEVKKSATRSIFLNNRANWEQTKEETRELHCDHPHPGDATAEGLWKKLKVTLKKQYQQRQQDKRNLSPGSHGNQEAA